MNRTRDEKIGNSEVDESSPMWQKIRDKLYIFALTNCKQIKQIYDTMQNISGLMNRDWELFHPILAIAKFIDDELYEKMVRFAKEKTDEKSIEDITESGEYVLAKSLVEFVEESGFYKVKDIRAIMEGNFDGGEKWLNDKWVGRTMGRFGFSNKRRVGSGIEYYLTPKMVKNLASRLSITTAQNSQTTLNPIEKNEVNVINEAPLENWEKKKQSQTVLKHKLLIEKEIFEETIRKLNQGHGMARKELQYELRRRIPSSRIEFWALYFKKNETIVEISPNVYQLREP